VGPVKAAITQSDETGTLSTELAAPATQVRTFITNLYNDALHRAPDAAGDDTWSALLASNLTTQAAVVTAFMNSTEAYGNSVTSVYQTVLGRAPDTGGFNYWLSFLAAGNSVEQMKAQFYGSDEYYQAHGSSNSALVTAYYQAFLNRTPDAGGLSYWTGRLNAGAARSAIAYAIQSSSTEGAQIIVENAYQTYLLRAPDPGGLAYWTALVQAGTPEAVIGIDFMSSAEYYNRT